VSKAGLSESIQDYLKSIYKLQSEHVHVTIGALAKDQGVSPASASAMVKKLDALELLEHEPYRGAQLTDAGERVALEVIRHHRLLELYLAKTLGVHVDDVSAVLGEAIRVGLEHREEALAYAERFGRGIDRETADRFVAMYVNELTTDYGDVGRRAVEELFRRAGAYV